MSNFVENRLATALCCTPHPPVMFPLVVVVFHDTILLLSPWPRRLAVRTRPFQGRGTGSIPVGVNLFSQYVQHLGVCYRPPRTFGFR